MDLSFSFLFNLLVQFISSRLISLISLSSNRIRIDLIQDGFPQIHFRALHPFGEVVLKGPRPSLLRFQGLSFLSYSFLPSFFSDATNSSFPFTLLELRRQRKILCCFLASIFKFAHQDCQGWMWIGKILLNLLWPSFDSWFLLGFLFHKVGCMLWGCLSCKIHEVWEEMK